MVHRMSSGNDEKGISRRGFIGLGVLAAAGTAGSLSGCAPKSSAERDDSLVAAADDWLGTPPEITEDSIVGTEETELLIIGAGTAGLCAAGTAADLGLDFIICEKGTQVAETREYYGVANSPLTIQAGLEVNTDKLFKELLDNKLTISGGQIVPALRWRKAALPQVGPPFSALI